MLGDKPISIYPTNKMEEMGPDLNISLISLTIKTEANPRLISPLEPR